MCSVTTETFMFFTCFLVEPQSFFFHSVVNILQPLQHMNHIETAMDIN